MIRKLVNQYGHLSEPELAAFTRNAVADMALEGRSILFIVPDSTRILVKPEEQSPQLTLTLDGQAGLEIHYGDAVLIENSPHPVYMIQVPDGEYFDVLKAKLSWSGGRA